MHRAADCETMVQTLAGLAGSLNAELEAAGIVLGADHSASQDGESLAQLMLDRAGHSHLVVHFDLQLCALDHIVSKSEGESARLLAQELTSSSALQLVGRLVEPMGGNGAELVLGQQRAEVAARLEAQTHVGACNVGLVELEAARCHAPGVGQLANKILR